MYLFMFITTWLYSLRKVNWAGAPVVFGRTSWWLFVLVPWFALWKVQEENKIEDKAHAIKKDNVQEENKREAENKAHAIKKDT